MQRRNLYLSTTPVEEALAKYITALDEYLKPQFEIIKVVDALDRVLKEAVYAETSSPMFNAAAMDGIAVNANDTINARETAPVILSDKNYKTVNTGDPIHTPFDAVIMAEDLVEHEDGKIEIRAAAAAWQNIRQIGEDIIQGEMLLPSSHKIRPFDMGALRRYKRYRSI
jgi:putative molybdopterin biosynthesis protein